MSSLGMPAVMSGGIGIETLQISPEEMALLDLSRYNDSRIAVLLGVPPFLAGLPSGGDSHDLQRRPPACSTTTGAPGSSRRSTRSCTPCPGGRCRGARTSR